MTSLGMLGPPYATSLNIFHAYGCQDRSVYLSHATVAIDLVWVIVFGIYLLSTRSTTTVIPQS